MTDFFSRIFAIPSDESSSYTPKPSPRSGSGGGGGGGHSGGRRKGTANGNGDGDEATPSLLEGQDGRRRPGRGSSQSSQSSRTSTSSETAEERRAGGERAKGSPRTPSSSAGAASPAAAGGGSPRGRQRRDRDPGGFGRSASEQPRGTDGKKHRSSSMSMASSQRRAVSSTGGMQLHMNMSSPKGGGGRRHRSLSKMGSRNSSSRGDSRTGGAAARANSWSEGEEEDEGRRRTRSSSKKGSGGRTRSGDRRPKADGHTSSEKARKEKEKEKEKKDKHGWRSRFSRKRHSPGATMAAEGTPPQHPPVKSKAKSKPKSALDRRDTPQSNPEKSGGGGRVRRSSSGRLPSVNINVGDSVVISQQFLEENAEISVLTLPKELRGDGDSAVAADFDQCIQEVGRRAAIENYRVQEFLERAAGGALCAGDLDAGSASTYGRGLRGLRGIEAASRPRVPAYDGVGAYASRALEEGDLYPSYGRDDRSEGRRPPCDPSAEGHSPRGEGDEGPGEDDGSSDSGSIPPPPPPPTPPPRSGRPPKSPTKQPTSHAVSPESSAPAVPHWNTPADGSGSVATSYNDPPGMLVTSPTSGAAELSPPNHRASADPPEGADPPERHGEEDHVGPPGDEAEGQPFDEGESGLGSPAAAAETLVVPRKAVTFALPPPSSSPVPPAPPFLGPPLDCYFSAERDDPDGPPPFRLTALGILPPIVELWSPVEEVVGAVAGNDVGWDEEKEDELLGEERPLRVSAEFIDILERELEQPQDEDEEEVEDEEDEATFAGLSPAHPIMPETNGDAFSDPSVDAFAESTQNFPDSNNHASPPNRLVGRQISAASAPSNWDEDLPHDEYFDDILNCGDDLLAGEAIGSADNGEDQWEGHPVARDSVSAPSSDARRELEGDDVDLRHRSMWNAAYRPPSCSPRRVTTWPRTPP
ncbi:hypothetical protein ACHAWF_009313 [Thalassiosira exigua]